MEVCDYTIKTVPRSEFAVYSMQGQLVISVSLMPIHRYLQTGVAVCAGVCVNMWARVENFACVWEKHN